MSLPGSNTYNGFRKPNMSLTLWSSSKKVVCLMGGFQRGEMYLIAI